jgi:hypothetical protein
MASFGVKSHDFHRKTPKFLLFRNGKNAKAHIFSLDARLLQMLILFYR